MSDSIKSEEVNLGDFGTTGAVNQLEEPLGELSVRSFPNDFIRVNDELEMSFTAHVMQDGNYDSYLVATAIATELGSDVKMRSLFLAQTASGDNFVLSVAAPTAKNRRNDWVRSGQEAIKKGMGKYIRVSRGNDAFRIVESQRPYPEIIWPDLSIEDMIEQAFADRMITDTNHPLVKELLGL